MLSVFAISRWIISARSLLSLMYSFWAMSQSMKSISAVLSSGAPAAMRPAVFSSRASRSSSAVRAGARKNTSKPCASGVYQPLQWMLMKSCARAVFAASTRSSNETSTSSVRVMTTSTPSSCMSRSRSPSAIARLTSFSMTPDRLTRPVFVPPWPGSTAIVRIGSTMARRAPSASISTIFFPAKSAGGISGSAPRSRKSTSRRAPLPRPSAPAVSNSTL